MATTEQLIWQAEVVDKATAALKSIEDQAKKTDQAVGGFGEKTDEAGESTDALAGSSGKLGGTMGGALAAGAAAAVAGIVAVTGAAAAAYAIAQKLTNAYEEQHGVNKRLANSLGAAAAAGEDISAVYGDMQSVIGQFAASTNFGDEAVSNALSTYQDLIPNLLTQQEAQHDLNTILGIAEQRQIDGEAASKLYAKAKTGEVTALSKVLGVQKETLTELQKTTDQTKRAEMATALLDKQYAGLAQGAAVGFFGAQKNLTDAIGDTQQALGGVIVESGALNPVLELGTGILLDMQAAVGENAEAWGQWLRDAVGTGLEYLVAAIEVAEKGAPVIAGVATYVSLVANAFTIWNNVLSIVGKAIVGFTTTVLGGMIEVLEPARALAVEFAGIIDEDLGKAFAAAKGPIDEAGVALRNFGGDALMSIGTDIDDISGDIGDIIAAIERAPEISSGTREVLENLRERVQKEREELAKVTENSSATDGVRGRGNNRSNVVSLDSKRTKEEADAVALRAMIAEKELAILQQQDVTKRAVLELELARLNTAKEILGTNLTDEELALRRYQAESAFQTKLADIERQRAEAKRAADAAAAERQKKQFEASLAQQKRVSDIVVQTLASVGGATGAATSKLVNDLAQVTRQFQEMRAAGDSTAQALEKSVAASGAATGSFLTAMGLGFREVAGIRAIFEQAAALAAFGSGNIPGGVAHQAAAVTFGVIAATGAGGGGKSGSSAAAASQSQAMTSSGGGVDIARIQEANTAAYVEAFRQTRAAGQTVNNYFTGNTFLEEEARIANRIERTVDVNRRTRLRAA